ncbi:MAG: DNA polymerase I [Anaerolineales bacterium]|nr:DNA polymerase I [Anaerolineales bacterium]
MPETLYLLDGYALAYRTYFALSGPGASRWMTSKGEPTAGVFGFASVLLRILEQEKPDYLAVAFDVGKTFRDDLFPDYKATREKMPDDLRVQINRIRQLVDAFNIPRLEVQGYEADDVLGSAARAAVDAGLGVKIITGDRDLLQLVDSRVIVNLPGRSLSEAQDYTADTVMESLGVRPDQVVDYKALCGDQSDNIPGVRGVGKKTAESLLAKYGTLDEIYTHLEELAPSQRKKLEEDRENAYLSQKLARIVTDLEVKIDLEKATITNFSAENVAELFRQLEFRSLMGRLQTVMESLGMVEPLEPAIISGQQMAMFPSVVAGTVETGLETVIVDSEDKLAALVADLDSAEMIAFDTETTGTDKMQANLVGISFATRIGKGYYVPVGHASGEQLPLEQVINAIRPAMTNPGIAKAGHNLKYDYVMLFRHGLKVHPLGFDTMLAEWLRDPASRNLGLKNLSWVRLGFRMIEIEELIGKGKNQITMAKVPIEQAAVYAAADAETVLRLVPELKKDLAAVGGATLFESMEMPLVGLLSEMEMNGIELDDNFLAQMSVELASRMTELEEEIFARVGVNFNLNSTQQLSDALFNKLGLQPPEGARKTASGHYSTAAGVLELLQTQDPVVQMVLEHRELAKLKSTYVDALPAQINPVTKRVHTSYQQTGSVTGRLASSDPNLQNIPIRSEMGRKVRQAFVAAPGNVLLGVDYSQVELRIVAHMADDDAMIKAFLKDQDIHATTASAVYGVSLDEVTSDQRRHAKAINFGLIYGMSPFGLTRTTDLTLAEAEDFVAAYFTQFPGVKKFLDGLRQQVQEKEYVETLLGRKRYFPGLSTQSNQNIRSRQLREAINAPIQGTAADIMKVAMLDVSKALNESGLGAKLLLQVHDEIVLECPQSELIDTAALVKDQMSHAYTLKVPLKTDARAGVNWGKMKPVGI